MATTGIQERAWQGRLDAEVKRRYFGRKADKYRHYHQGLILLFGLTSAGSTAVVAITSNWGAAIAGLSWMGTCIAITAITLDFSGKSAMAASASDYYGRLSARWRDVWWRQHEPNIGEVIKDLEQQDVGGPDVPINDDEALIEACEVEVDRVVHSEYAPGLS